MLDQDGKNHFKLRQIAKKHILQQHMACKFLLYAIN